MFQTTADTGEQRDLYILRAFPISLLLDVRGGSPTLNRQKVGKIFRFPSWPVAGPFRSEQSAIIGAAQPGTHGPDLSEDRATKKEREQ